MQVLWQDVRFAARVVLARPLLALTAILTLGLGIGASTAVFSVYDTVLLRALPYQDAQRLVVLRENIPSITDMLPITALEYVRVADQATTLDDLTLADRLGFNLLGEGEPVRVDGALVTGNFFKVLGVSPWRGRDFTSADDRPGANDVVIISHGLWQRRFGSDPSLVGRTIRLNVAATYGPPRPVSSTVTVIGILPPDFRSPFEDEEIWMPMALDRAGADANLHFLFSLGRLAPGVTVDKARAELGTVLRGVTPEHPLHKREGRDVTLVPLRDLLVRNVETGLTFVLAAVGLVLIIACINVANLLLVGAVTRQREVALRNAIGATPWRLARQFLTESLLLAALGGVVGMALAWAGIHFIVANGPGNIPRLDAVSLDLRVLLFALLVTAVTGVVAGLAPALRAIQTVPTEVLKEGGRVAGPGGWAGRLRSGLVVLEVALALVVLVGAGLLIRSFEGLQSLDYGFRSESLLTMRASLPQSKYREGFRQAAFFRSALERVEAIPVVESAALVNTLPLSLRNTASGLTIEGREQLEGDALTANTRQVSSDYFDTMGIPLLQGRAFDPLDMDEHPRVAIINETAAKRFWPDESALDRRLTLGAADGQTVTVVGVVGDVLQRRLSTEVVPTVYLPSLWSSSMTFVARTSNDPLDDVDSVRATIQQVDADQPVEGIATMRQVVGETTSRPRFNALLLTILAFVALFLATVGIYGVMHYSVTQRTQEVGVRMSLGASRRDVLGLILRRAVWLATIGVVAGLVGAFALTRLMTSQLYGVSPTDPWTFALTALILIAVALAAGFIPARRATRVDPVDALRSE